MRLLIVVVAVLGVAALAGAEMFSALVDLEKVLYAENGVAKDLRQYIADEEVRLAQLKSVAEDYEKHSQEALENINSHLANPANAFLLVKRFTVDWKNVQKLISNKDSEVFLDQLSSRTCDFPSTEDLDGAATALMRLQDVYALPTEQIAKGQFEGSSASPEFTADDCFELGRVAYNSKDYYHTVIWMDEALQRLQGSETATGNTRASIIDYLAFSASMQGDLWRALNLTIELLKLQPDHVRAQNNKRYYEEAIAKAAADKSAGPSNDDAADMRSGVKNERKLDEYRNSQEFRAYEALCRGEKTHVYKYAHKLTCQFRHYHPMFYINPLREEVHYLDPRLVVFHQLITDAEIAKVKELATPRLYRATVQNPGTGQLEPAVYRVSKSSWLKDEYDPLIASISRKSAAVSNLTLETVEELQVLNYGIGGHYEPHFDFARTFEKNTFESWRGNRVATVIFYKDEHSSFAGDSGNRIATVMIYMTDVQAGGSTVFTSLGVEVKPEKGMCAVWYNLRRNGDGDYQTRHAACPVLIGTKWVCNKWFHERGQEFSRGCSTNPAD